MSDRESNFTSSNIFHVRSCIHILFPFTVASSPCLDTFHKIQNMQFMSFRSLYLINGTLWEIPESALYSYQVLCFRLLFFLRGNNVYSYLCPWIVVLNQQLPIQTHSQYRVLNFKIMNDCLIKDNVHLVRNNSNAHLKSPSSTQCYFIDFPRLWGMSSSIIRYLMNAKYNYLFGNKNECCINCRQNSKLWIHLLCIDVSCNTLSPFMSVETDTMPSSRKHSTHLNSR